MLDEWTLNRTTMLVISVRNPCVVRCFLIFTFRLNELNLTVFRYIEYSFQFSVAA